MPTRLLFVRHGATAANLAGLRCGGDLDLPLTDEGREQARAAGRQIAALPTPPGLIVTSALDRTVETARLIALSLPGIEILVRPALAERRLGLWNLRTIEVTQPWFDARQCPPAGESHEAFADRISAAAVELVPLLPSRPLLVGSKGVARVLGELCGVPRRSPLANAALVDFDFTPLCRPVAAGAIPC